MKTIAASFLIFVAPSVTFAQDFNLDDVINVSWCVGSKVVNTNGVVRDCRSTALTPVCKESASKKGDRIIISANCVR